MRRFRILICLFVCLCMYENHNRNKMMLAAILLTWITLRTLCVCLSIQSTSLIYPSNLFQLEYSFVVIAFFIAIIRSSIRLFAYTCIVKRQMENTIAVIAVVISYRHKHRYTQIKQQHQQHQQQIK